MLLHCATEAQAGALPFGILPQIRHHPPVKRRADFFGPSRHFFVVAEQFGDVHSCTREQAPGFAVGERR